MGKFLGLAAGLGFAWFADAGFLESLAVVALGFAFGLEFDRRRAPVTPKAPAPVPLIDERLARIERRLEALERALGPAPRGEREPAADWPEAPPPAVVAPVAVVDAAVSPAPEPAAEPADPPPRPAYGARPDWQATMVLPGDAPATGANVPAALTAARPQPRLWGWFTEGNTLTRVGVVILFFGVAFLLAWFADHLTLSIEASLALVALAGAVLIGLGAWLAGSRPGYGLSLQGAGAGVLYLTTFAASRLFDVLPPLPAMAALAAVAALTVALAWRADSQALAATAIAGGFLAPFLVARETGAPAALFSWFAVLNAAVFALAWRRPWRALNALGAVFTFGLGFVWGWEAYRPMHFAVAQPFLALFFAFYVGVAILHAKRAPLEDRRPVDALIVFGVPVMAFALEAGLVADHRHGASYAALALAAIYAVLFAVLRTRLEPGLALLARSFLALAVVFATVAVPFAFDARWTSAWWGLEAAAVYWIGCAQDQRLARRFALALQGAAAVAFLLDIPSLALRPLFANASFLGAAMIGTAALVSAWSADRHRAVLGPRERAFSAVVFAWGVAWWLVAGVDDVLRVRPGWLGPGPGTSALAWVAATSAVALALSRALDWPRLAWFGAGLAPAAVLAFAAQFEDARTTLVWPGVLVWPAAWLLHWATLRAVERNDEPPPAWLAGVHWATAVAFVAWAAWEASEWTGRTTPRGSAWIACAAALPGVAMLAATRVRAVLARWPVARFPEAYLRNAGTTVSAALAVWFAGTNAISPGTASPLPWYPLLNPLDLTLAATLVVVTLWARDHGGASPVARERALAAALFVAGNGFILRFAHQWGDVPWRLSSLMSNKPVQAAITLAWTATALVLMVWASRRASRVRWLAGATLLAAVVLKLFVIDLAALSGLPRVAAFLGAGVMLLAIGYFAPPPSEASGQAAATSEGSASPDGARST